MREQGIWVRIITEGAIEVTGHVAGADSPNDFWTAFKTQCVHVDKAVETLPSGRKTGHDALYVNRDRIVAVSVLPREP
jgi:hypothetical protein